MRNKHSSLKIGIGTPTILMIFVVLCMIILSVLSYMDASNNYSLTMQEKEYVENYYEANIEAEEIKRIIENDPINCVEVVRKKYNIYLENRNGIYEYYVGINYKKELQVVLNQEFKIDTWKVKSRRDLND